MILKAAKQKESCRSVAYRVAFSVIGPTMQIQLHMKIHSSGNAPAERFCFCISPRLNTILLMVYKIKWICQQTLLQVCSVMVFIPGCEGESGARGRQQPGTGWDAAEVQTICMGS